MPSGGFSVDTMGRALRTRRRDLGLTQKELARLAGCGVVFLYDLEQGKPTVQLDKLLSVLEVLGARLRLEAGPGPLRVDDSLPPGEAADAGS